MIGGTAIFGERRTRQSPRFFAKLQRWFYLPLATTDGIPRCPSGDSLAGPEQPMVTHGPMATMTSEGATKDFGSGVQPMLADRTVIRLGHLRRSTRPKGATLRTELTAITERGRGLAGYDAAAWHASDAIQAKAAQRGKHRPVHRQGRPAKRMGCRLREAGRKAG